MILSCHAVSGGLWTGWSGPSRNGEADCSAWRMTKHSEVEIVLVRSCRTEWDETDRVCGRCQPRVCEEAFAEYRGAVAQLGARLPRIVYSPPDDVTLASALVLAQSVESRVRELDGLEELGLGLWEGLRRADLRDRFPKAFRAWEEDPTSATPPEGERIADAADRLTETLSRAIQRTKEERVGVVLRTLSMGIVRCTLRRQPLSGLWSEVRATPLIEVFRINRSTLFTGSEPAVSLQTIDSREPVAG